MRVAQNTCVGMQTKGVILAGDNQVHFLLMHYAHRSGEQPQVLACPSGTTQGRVFDTPQAAVAATCVCGSARDLYKY